MRLWHLFLIGSFGRASWILRTKGVESGRCYCQTVHHGMWPYIAFIKFRLIWSAAIFWSIIELLIGELYNQGRCDRHTRQLYGSVAGNSGDIFFTTCFCQFMIFCAKFYFSAQIATMAIGNANPDWMMVNRLGRLYIKNGLVSCSNDWLIANREVEFETWYLNCFLFLSFQWYCYVYWVYFVCDGKIKERKENKRKSMS